MSELEMLDVLPKENLGRRGGGGVAIVLRLEENESV